MDTCTCHLCGDAMEPDVVQPTSGVGALSSSRTRATRTRSAPPQRSGLSMQVTTARTRGSEQAVGFKALLAGLPASAPATSSLLLTHANRALAKASNSVSRS